MCSTWCVHFDERTENSVDLFMNMYDYLLFLSCVSHERKSPALKAYT
jgi:hypothetical protein